MRTILGVGGAEGRRVERTAGAWKKAGARAGQAARR